MINSCQFYGFDVGKELMNDKKEQNEIQHKLQTETGFNLLDLFFSLISVLMCVTSRR